MAAMIAAIIIIAGFGTTLLVWFHYEDKHDSRRLSVNE